MCTRLISCFLKMPKVLAKAPLESDESLGENKRQVLRASFMSTPSAMYAESSTRVG